MVSASVPSQHPLFAIKARAKAAARAEITRLMPIVLLFYSAMLPPEVQVSFGQQTIYPHRIIFFLFVPWLLGQMLNGGYRFRLIDLVVLTGIGWMVTSFIAYYGLIEGITRGGALAMDNLFPYFYARVSIRNTKELRRFLVIVTPAVFVIALTVAAESLSHHQIVRPFAAAIFGQAPNYAGGQTVGAGHIFTNYRLGLLRAAGPFTHPIMAGVFFGSLLPIYFLSGLKGWPRYLGIASGLFSVFTVSSSAIVALAIAFGMIGYNYLHRKIIFASWRLFTFAVIAGMLAVQLLSKNGLVNVLIHYTIDPATGYYRRLIWEYGFKSMLEHPWFGIGFSEYARLPWMIASVDTQWLSIGIKHGFVTPIAFILATALVIIALFRRSEYTASSADRDLLVGVGISNLLILLLGFTVAFFGGVLIWVFILLGIGATVSQPAETPVQLVRVRPIPQ